MALAIEKDKDVFLYQQVIDLIREMKSNGTLKPGDKLPSLRNLSRHLSVSIPTVKQAYIELEQQSFIHARPKSGYFLSGQPQLSYLPKKARFPRQARQVSRVQLIEEVFNAIHKPGNLHLGVANPVAALPASKALARTMRRVLSVAGDRALEYGALQGHEPLRRQLAMRYLEHGIQLGPDDITITNGAQEAINIALQTVAKPGDIVAVESPCYFGLLELIESLGMLALEIPLCAEHAIDIEDVHKAIHKHNIKAFLFSTSIANPIGSLLSNDKKQALVELLERHDVPMIEDDVYGELNFSTETSTPAHAFSKKGLVLSCSSFSKTVAPSYRVGWIATHKFAERTRRIRRAISCSSSLLNQWTLSEFLRGGEHDRYLSQLRQVLQTHKERMRSLIAEHFDPRIGVTNPSGGSVLWLELPQQTDGEEVFHRALEQKISISPGIVFSPSDRYKHCIRISYGLPWTPLLEQGIKTLGALCR